MAKANLKFSRIGNDGYDYARRESDGVWFVREGYHGAYGWAKTKWSEVRNTEENMVVINQCLKVHEAGETSLIVGFSSQVIITDGKGLRLP